MSDVTLDEIRAGMIRLLREGTDVPNITGEDVSQAKSLPLLHVQLEPLSYRTAAAGYFADKEILVDISYMEQLVTSNRSIYAMLERLDRIFRPFFKIGGRAFTCDAQMSIMDDIGHYKMTLKFCDTEPFEVPEPVADALQVDWRDENGIT